MGNPVVVGVDGSSAALTAVAAAAAAAARCGAALRVVHAEVPIKPRLVVPDPAVRPLVLQAMAHALHVVPEAVVTSAVVTGDVVHVLEAESQAADLVVVGSRGTGSITRRLLGSVLGSTPAPLAARSHCPVMVVRGDDPDPTGPVVLGVDGSPDGEQAVAFAFAESARRRAELVAVHAWQPDRVSSGTAPEAAERLLDQALADAEDTRPDVTVRREPVGGKASEVLVEASRTAQLLVVGARGRGGLAGLLLGSVSQDVMTRALPRGDRSQGEVSGPRRHPARR